MFDRISEDVGRLTVDRDEVAIRQLLTGLQGDEIGLPDHVFLNLKECATMALFHGRRIKLQSQDAFDALAALCLVLGDRRVAFFENVFVDRMITNRNLSAREKLNRLIEIIIGTVPRPAQCRTGDTTHRETA